MISEEKTVQKILEQVGKPVSFNFPPNEPNRKGILRDREVVKSIPGAMDVQYWDVVDKIEFPDNNEQMWIRIGYYRQVGDKIRYASQTTITEPISIWKKLLVQTAKEKIWFKELLFEVFNELEK
jgi:hypothetical protein